MKIALFLLALGSTTSAMAADFSLGLSNASVTQKDDYTKSDKSSQTAHVGISNGLTDNLSLSLRLGYGEIGNNAKQYDRFAKVMPKYVVYRPNPSGAIYATAGIGLHSILSHGQINMATGLVGVGFESDLNANGFRMGFEVTYEESLKRDYELDNVKLIGYKFSSIDTTLTISYKL